MTSDISGRVALITGAARGMGRAMALAFAGAGADTVVVNFRTSGKDAAATVRAIEAQGSSAIAIKADVSRQGEVNALFEAVRDKFGRLDILVNNAGVLLRGSVDELSERQWDATIAVNLKAAFLCTKAALPLLRQSNNAVVLNVASGGAGMRGQAPRLAHYYAAKAGLITYTKCLARELAPIRVNCLAPGFTDTGFGDPASTTREEVLGSTPLGRLGQPDDVANGALFLVSDDAAFITGHVLTIDGGRSM